MLKAFSRRSEANFVPPIVEANNFQWIFPQKSPPQTFIITYPWQPYLPSNLNVARGQKHVRKRPADQNGQSGQPLRHICGNST